MPEQGSWWFLNIEIFLHGLKCCGVEKRQVDLRNHCHSVVEDDSNISWKWRWKNCIRSKAKWR